MSIKEKKGNEEKIAIYSDHFIARTDAYGTYDPETGKTYQKKEPVTKHVILNHLLGKQPYGMYMLMNDKTNVIVVDFDNHDQNPVIAFVNRAKHYGLFPYIERSKSKGWHIWIFFEKGGVNAVKARTVAHQILEDIDAFDIEVFPKQNVLAEGKWGSFINSPLFGRLVSKNRTVFVDPVSLKPFKDQWDYISKIERVTEENLEDLIELNDWSLISNHQEKINKIYKPKLGNKFQTLLPCAQKMLQGVSQFQRVLSFRLAIHLCSAGFDQILSLEILRIWTTRNTPINGKTIIKDSEIIVQCNDGFKENHTSYGCGSPETKPYCSKICKLFNVNIKI